MSDIDSLVEDLTLIMEDQGMVYDHITAHVRTLAGRICSMEAHITKLEARFNEYLDNHTERLERLESRPIRGGSVV